MTLKNRTYWRQKATGLISWDIEINHMISKLFDYVDHTFHSLFDIIGTSVSLYIYGEKYFFRWKCSPWKMQNFHFVFFFLLLRLLLLKAQFNLVPANILKIHDVHPVLWGKWAELPGFFHISVQINVSSTINMQTKVSIESLPSRGLLLSFYELMKLGVLANEPWYGPKIKKLYSWSLSC